MASLEEDGVIIAENEFQKMKLLHQKSGYRDGVVKGAEKTLQEGFNQGFRKGVDTYFEVGQLIGEISAYKSWYETQDNKSVIISSLEELKQEIMKNKDNKEMIIMAAREKLKNILLLVDYKSDSK